MTYVLSALISWTVAMAMGEMSSVHPAAGSFGVYAELYLNDWAGFVVRYGFWFAIVTAIGSELVAAGTYMLNWFHHTPILLWMIVFGLFLLLINLFSVGNYGTFEYWFALIKVITIVVFIVAGAALLAGGKVHAQYVAQGGFAPNGWAACLMAISFGLFSFLGIEMVAVSSGEARSGREVGRAMRIAFSLLTFIYIGAIAVLVGVMPWRSAGVSESPFVTVFKVAGIPAAGFIMNFVVLTAALSGANASIYAASRMLFSLARSEYAPQRLARLNQHGVPMAALLASMAGIVVAVVVQFFAPKQAYLFIIGVSLVGGMLSWLVSLLAHVQFRRKMPPEQLAALPLRSPLGAAGSVFGFVAVLAAIVLTWRVPQSRITLISAGPYLLVLSAAYFLVRRNHRTARRGASST
jgi:L-asparagine transporter-like permease